MRDPQTCPWRPCGGVDCCEYDGGDCPHNELANALRNAILNERRDQAVLDRDDYEEMEVSDD